MEMTRQRALTLDENFKALCQRAGRPLLAARFRNKRHGLTRARARFRAPVTATPSRLVGAMHVVGIIGKWRVEIRILHRVVTSTRT